MQRVTPIPLALKAEAQLAVQLVIRHRAPRLTATLVLTAVFLAGVAGAGGIAPLLLAAGALGAVIGSRPLARGPAAGTARFVPASPWVPATGRYLGVLATTLPAVAVAASVLTVPAAAPFMRAFVAAGLLSAALAAVGLGLAPFVGATPAATLGLALALGGGLAPADVAALGLPAPVFERVGVALWEVLPLPWRAVRWQAVASPADAVCFLAWTGAGLAAAALGVRARRRP